MQAVGSSFTEYQGAGFWTRDVSIELWLYLLAEEARQLDNLPAWLQEAAEDWHIQATVGMGGCVSAGLDQYAPTPERAAVVWELVERALDRLQARGEVIRADWLNTLGLGGPGATFTRDLPAEVFTRVGEALIRLLRGEITWDASTSPVL
jgi:hypothetical protein